MTDKRAPLAPVLVFVALFFLAWTLRATLLYRIDTSIDSEALRHVYSNAIKFALWVVPVFIYLRRVGVREPLCYLKLTTKPDRKGLPVAAVAVVIYFAVVVLVALFAQGRRVSLAVSGVALASTAVSSFSEEILFRGFLLNQLRERLRFWTANVIAALLFATVHLPNWLWTRGFQAGLLFDLFGVFALALFLGYLLRATNTLWSCVFAHVLNNFIAGLLRP
ncbi:MAG: CPBP family intramembrane metalloprotease [Acidobacteriota bacterium]|nr:CPBP family intramembrane metalloprotease [Acidobacteriota bacterium]